ncbi:hypothetical protein LTR37_002614 [Vermiconidia calcicola]|uniref:Uncharacterized protein n=1 Tax=Vermiconidia calcicola TaxID=1690605 RepID=A0ACC3NSJ3_9PEZI|nr:hypothetical protein LTR37_002614 [Vermiconidia calcicola]
MAPSNPPRRFAPTPIEQTAKSSRQTETPKDDNEKPRRFKPEPVEETVRSSKDTSQQQKNGVEEKPKPRRFAPEPVEQTAKSSKDVTRQAEQDKQKPQPRRFAPQVVEETHKSSKDVAEQEKPKPRRFAPQVVEETQKTSKDKPEQAKRAHVKFQPEPVSVTYGSNRKAKHGTESQSTSEAGDDTEKKQPRKFTPILLDTATRSRKAGDGYPTLSQADRTEYAYHLHSKEHWKRVTGEPAAKPEPTDDDVDMEDADDVDASANAYRSMQMRKTCALDGSSRTRPSVFAPARQHSFRMPELDTIESSESERDSSTSSLPPSPRTAGSPITASDTPTDYFRHATRIRESIDENFTHYLLDIERKKARERLEEQALAAYPNIDFGYEAPNHYLNNDDDDEVMEIEDRPVTWDGFEDDDEDLFEMPRREWHRESTTKVPWEQLEMQRYAEEMQQERNASKTTAKATTAKQPDQTQNASPWGGFARVKDPIEDNPELKSMRDRARPPMLGGDLVFPRCPSPEPARFDVTQGAAALRNQMSNLAQAAENERVGTTGDGGLWKVGPAQNNRVSTLKSQASPPKKSPAKGLWGGFCVDDGEKKQSAGLTPPSGPTGIMTPKAESPNPFDLAFTEDRPIGLQTPQMKAQNTKEVDLRTLDAVLITESDFEGMMDREYPDSFITQVYNYLSLGYPSLARPFDEELSKISLIPIAELRQDDKTAKATPRGYIRLGSDFEGGGGQGVSEESCVRWQALKRYVREWARQEKNMVKSDGPGGNWGTGARRGSWAI